MLRRAPQDKAAAAGDRPGFLARLRERLNRGNSWLTYDLADLFNGRQIDAAILEELETRLITADVGVEATGRILDELRQRVARQRARRRRRADRRAARRRSSRSSRPAPSRSSSITRRKPFVILVVGVNGSGKTTTIGKLARRCADDGRQRAARRGRYLPRRRDRAAEGVGGALRRRSSPRSARRRSGRGGVRRAAGGTRARHRRAARGHRRAAAQPVAPHGRAEEGARVDPARRPLRARTRCCWCSMPTRGRTRSRRRGSSTQAVGVTGLALTKLDGTAKGGIVIAIAQQPQAPDPLHRHRRAARGLRRVRRRGVRRRAGRRAARAGAHDHLRSRQQALPQRTRGAQQRQLQRSTTARWCSSPAARAPARARC